MGKNRDRLEAVTSKHDDITGKKVLGSKCSGGLKNEASRTIGS